THPAFEEAAQRAKDRIQQVLSIGGKRTVDSYHRELGAIMWNKCGMSRNATGLREAISEVRALREDFYRDLLVPGRADDLNPALEKALRVADFLELAELMCIDALHRNESCGGHFREEYQTADGEALRDDQNFSYVAAWQYDGDGNAPILHKEPLTFEYVRLAERNYK
ncbi:MAG: fumarate reductase/succinate dehydrogenase flavoprotein subunit, partial [Dehalococcoidia bacterium]|nr:fumarate reductase/succinate dehydrogenase flavoprotein subunit [Dehalococcoidia bacterium]